MTRDELFKLVDSFGKNKGEYSEEEIIEIGTAHKKLPRSERSWAVLADRLGWEGTGESLRLFVKNKLYSNKQTDEKKEISQNERDVDIEYLDKKSQLEIDRILARNELNAYKRLVKTQARAVSLRNTVEEVINNLGPLPFISFKESKCKGIGNVREAVLMVSDWHIGVDCNNFYNTYNFDVAKTRIKKLTVDVINYCKSFKVQRLNVVNLGDLIHGKIHKNARIENEFDVVQQVIKAAELLAEMLNQLQEAAPEVIYRSVIDNHARMDADLEEALQGENFGILIDHIVQLRLQVSKATVQFAFDNLDESMGKFVLLNGKNVAFAHGHLDSINKAYQNFTAATREFIHYVLLGHYHEEKAKSYNGCKVLVNSCLSGVEQYALSKRLFGVPSQSLLLFEDDNLINVSINVGDKK